MPGPKKKISKTKIYKDTDGAHVVSPDGSHVKIGGSTFRRTVLPSVATAHVESEKFASELEELEAQPFKEADTEGQE
jgi:hypothetical protein